MFGADEAICVPYWSRNSTSFSDTLIMLTNQLRLGTVDHVTAITADGQRCLDFYAGVLGLAFVGGEPDFEAPDSHLLSFAPEAGRPRGVLSFIEAPGLRRGQTGA